MTYGDGKITMDAEAKMRNKEAYERYKEEHGL